MAVKSSGSLSFDMDIAGEFKDTKPHSLSEFYAGKSGGPVPANTKNGAGVAIPTAGTIKFSDFYGAMAKFIPPAPGTDPTFTALPYEMFTCPDDANKTVLLFRQSGTVNFPSGFTAHVVVVGGGGASGAAGNGRDQSSAGGSGGGIVEGDLTIAAGANTITVGRGGQDRGHGLGGQAGQPSQFMTLKADGGGGSACGYGCGGTEDRTGPLGNPGTSASGAHTAGNGPTMTKCGRTIGGGAPAGAAGSPNAPHPADVIGKGGNGRWQSNLGGHPGADGAVFIIF